jgi:O-antigen/teichoic acid export membrane protein
LNIIEPLQLRNQLIGMIVTSAKDSEGTIGRDRRPMAPTALVQAMLRRFPSASQGILSIFDQAIVSATSFFTAVIVGRMSTPDEFGLYYLMLSVVLIASGVHEQLIAAPYMVYSKRRQGQELAEYAGSVWLHHLGLMALVTLGLAVALVSCAIKGNQAMVSGLWAVLCAAPLILCRDGIRRYNFANLHVKSAVLVDAIVAVIQLGGLTLLAYFGQLSLFRIYAVMGLACTAAAVVWYFADPPQIDLMRDRALGDWRRNWGFGKWALRSYLIGSTTSFVMLWIVSLAVGATAAGFLGACTTLVGATNVILIGVANILTPQAALKFTTGGTFALRRILLRTAVFLVLTLGAYAFFLLLTGDWLTVFVFGEHYEGTAAILFTLALSALMNGLSMVAGNGLWAINQPRANFLADICSMSTTLVIAAFLIRPWEAWGAALALLAGTLTACIVRTFTLMRCLEADGVLPGMATSPTLSS